MNEHTLIIGETTKKWQDMKGGKFCAQWANNDIQCCGNTPLEAVSNLFKEMYPGLWYLNQQDEKDKMLGTAKIDGKDKPLGVCKKWIKLLEGEKP